MGCVPSSELDAPRNSSKGRSSSGKRRSRGSKGGRKAGRRSTNPAQQRHQTPATENDGNESQHQRVLQENEQQQPTVAAPTRSSESRADVDSIDGAAVGSSPARTEDVRPESHHPPLADHPPEQPVSPPRASSLASATEMSTRRGSAARPLLPPVVAGGRSVAATTSGQRSNSASGSAQPNQPPTDPMIGSNSGNENSRHSASLKSAPSEDRRRGSRSSQTGGGVNSSPNGLRRSNSVTAAVTLMGSRPGGGANPDSASTLRDSHGHSRSAFRTDPRIEQWLGDMIEDTFAGDFSGPDEFMSEAYRPEPIPDLDIDQGCSPDCDCNAAERRSQSIHQRARSELLVNPLAGFR